jgi:hypothetical protein
MQGGGGSSAKREQRWQPTVHNSSEIKKDAWSLEEDTLIIRMHKTLGT